MSCINNEIITNKQDINEGLSLDEITEFLRRKNIIIENGGLKAFQI